MKREIDCNIARDLLPSYIDGILSDESRDCVDNHLKNCKDCSEIYESMTADIKVNNVPEVGNVKKFLNRTKAMYLLYGLFGLSFISILVCLIVNLCVDGRITWSLIPAVSVVFGDVVFYTFVTNKRNKLVKTLTVISVGVPALLSIIQVVLYYMMNRGELWLFKMGLPIALLWIAVVWVAVLLRSVFKVRLLYCLSVFALIGVVANYFTNIITGDITTANMFSGIVFLRTGFGNLCGAIVFAVLGTVINLDRKNRR